MRLITEQANRITTSVEQSGRETGKNLLRIYLSQSVLHISISKKKKIAVCESRLSLPYHVMSWWWHGRIWPCPSGSPQTPQLHSLALSHPSNENKISIIISLLLILGAKLFSRTEVHGGKVTVECSMKNLICNNSLKHTLQKGQLLVT